MSECSAKTRAVVVDVNRLICVYRDGTYRDTRKIRKGTLFLRFRLRRAFRKMERLHRRLTRIKARLALD